MTRAIVMLIVLWLLWAGVMAGIALERHYHRCPERPVAAEDV